MTRILVAFLALSTLATTVRAADAPKVLVVPFNEISEGAKRDWVGRAIQQSLVAELSRLPIVSPMDAKPEVGVIDDADEAVRAAKGAGAAYTVFGSYQLVEQELRVLGQVVDASSGAVLGGIKSTGNLRDLFGVEDIVAAQVKRALTQKLAPPTTQPANDLAERTTVEPSGPVRLTAEGQGFRGSELEQSLSDNRPYAAAPPTRPYDDERERYRYAPPPYAPYGWSPYGYGYPYGGGYTPRYPYRYGHPSYSGYGGYCNDVVIVRRRPTVRVLVPVAPRQTQTRVVPNGNFNRGQGNTMQSGPGNTMTGRGSSGNTVTPRSGNTNRSQ